MTGEVGKRLRAMMPWMNPKELRGTIVATAQREIPDGERLARVDNARELSEQEMLELHQTISELSSKLDRDLRWTLGTLISLWVTVILSIAGLYAAVLRI